MRAGRRIAAADGVAICRDRFEADLVQLSDAARDLSVPFAPVAEITAQLRLLTAEVQQQARRRTARTTGRV